MEKKDRSRKQQPENAAGSDLHGFEDVDFSAQAETAAPEVEEESLGGLDGAHDFKSLMRAQKELEERLLVSPDQAMAATAEDGVSGLGNIVGIGIGEKEVDGYPTGTLALKVFVKEKLSSSDVSAEALVPSSLGGLPTDVDRVGEIHANMFTARLRPAPGAVLIGNCSRVMAGTLGCLVRRGNQLFILSNNHVMALVNASPIGTLIPQPGRLDGGVCPNDVIARLSAFVPIDFSPNACNIVDAAIAQTSPTLVDKRILRPLNVRQPESPASAGNSA